MNMQGLSAVPGWFDYPDVYDRIAALDVPGDVVEVGSWFGASTIYLGHHLPVHKRLFAVDPGVASLDGLDERGRDHVVSCYHAAGGTSASVLARNLYAAGLTGGHLCRVVQVVAPSVVAAKLFAPGSLSAVFIDGDHSYEGVTTDIETWLPCVAPGGIIAGHDYAGPIESVSRAVDDFFQAVDVVGRCWLVQVPR